jgi:hypothetical protein
MMSMRIDTGNRSTRRKPAPVPLCPPQIQHEQTWDRTRAAALGSWHLTASALARPIYLSIYLCIYGSILVALLLHLDRFFSFLILYTAGRTPWTGDQPVARPLPTHRTTQTQNKRRQTSMPCVGFEPTIPVFEREKTDRAATVIGLVRPCLYMY